MILCDIQSLQEITGECVVCKNAVYAGVNVWASAMHLCVRNMDIWSRDHFSISKHPFHSVNLKYA